MPLRHADVPLHGRQIRSPAQTLGNSFRQIKQFRIFAPLELFV